jgi:hypothetical protein
MSRIVWLASYPKSGNTWLRVFLANLRAGGEQAVDINAISKDELSANDRAPFDDLLGVESSDLLPEEIDCYRPWVYRAMAAESPTELFLKIHDAFTRAQDGAALFPADVSRGVLYVVRNPLDVAVSLAHHAASPVEAVVQRMAKRLTLFGSHPRALSVQLHQRLSSWSGHVLSWLDQSEIPVHVMRYEDMRAAPLETFQAAARFAGLPDAPEQVARALAHSRFEVLKAQEEAHGFKERPGKAKAFFRKGQVGSWREELSPELAERIVRDHGDVMKRLGYLPEQVQSTAAEVLA